MIKGEVVKVKNSIIKPDVNYRKINALNCSMIKLFDSNPVKFFDCFKLGRVKDDVKSTAIVIGDIVDFYILDCKGNNQEFEDRFEEKFSLLKDVSVKGQVSVLVEELYKIAKKYTVDGKITAEFSTMFSEAVQKVQSLGKYSGKTEEKILEDFSEKGKEYYETLIKNSDKTVVDVNVLDHARNIAKILVEDEFTAHLFEESEDIEYFTKFPIEWTYEAESGGSMICKSELDILRIDHHNKIIYPMDLKTTYDNENFESNYLRMRYDLQAAFYHLAVLKWSVEEDMQDYDIMPMEFIVGDTSINKRRPIRYKLSRNDLDKAMYGYHIGGVKYNGIIPLIEAINWAENSGNWNVSKEVFDNQGIMKLGLKYE